MLAVPSHPALRALATTPPASSRRGRRPTRPWPHVEAWSQALAAEAWRRLDVREGAKGPLGVEVVQRRGGSRTPRRQQGDEELWVVMRYGDRDQEVVQVDDDLSHAAPETPLWALARVAKAEQRLEAWPQRRKSEAGWADYEVRHGPGWQHHPTLSLLATWCLGRETPRGKNMAPGDHLPPDSPRQCNERARGLPVGDEVAYAAGVPEALATQGAGSLLSLETA